MWSEIKDERERAKLIWGAAVGTCHSARRLGATRPSRQLAFSSHARGAYKGLPSSCCRASGPRYGITQILPVIDFQIVTT